MILLGPRSAAVAAAAAALCFAAASVVSAQSALEVERLQKVANLEGGLGDVNAAGDKFGTSTCILGDLDNNGVVDVGVGASGYGASDRGALYVLFMNANGTVASAQRIAEGEGGFVGPLATNDQFGWACALVGHNLTGSGRPLVAVGAIGDQARGAVWLFELEATGMVAVGTAVKLGNGTSGMPPLVPSDVFGGSVAAVHGVESAAPVLAVGAPGSDRRGEDDGAVYLLWIDFAATPLTVTRYQEISNAAGNLTAAGGNFGHVAASLTGISVADIGDLDGDGVNELAVGAVIGRSAVHVLFLTPSTGMVRRALNLTQGGFSGPLGPNGQFGNSVAGIGDADGDGVNDMVVGASGLSSFRGSLWLVLLHADGTVKGELLLSSNTTNNGNLTLGAGAVFGRAVAFLGDLDPADGFGLDVIVGANEEGASTLGSAYVISLVAMQPAWTTGLTTGTTGTTGAPSTTGTTATSTNVTTTATSTGTAAATTTAGATTTAVATATTTGAGVASSAPGPVSRDTLLPGMAVACLVAAWAR